MSWPLVHIGEHVEKVETWNPVSSGIEDLFKYIDLSSVDKDSKSIIEAAVNLFHPISAPSRARQLVKENDVLISTVRPNLNGVALVNQELDGATASTGYCVLRANKKSLDSKYLFYWVQSSDFIDDMIKNATGANYPAVSDRIVKNSLIPLPPLEEQKRIAAILDKADAIRRKRQKAIKLADDFLRSVFLEMFGDPLINPKGWEVKALGDLCDDLFLGLTSAVDYIDDENGYPLIRAKDINTGELSFEEVKYISAAQHKKLTKNHLTKKGDLLISKSGTLGTCAIVRTDREFSTYESIFTVRPSRSKLDIHYLIHLLQNKGFKEKLIGNKVGGTVAHLNLKMFRDFNIGIPPIHVQRNFSEKIIRCEQKIEKYKKSEIEVDSFFSSLSQKAFSGGL